MSSKTGKNNKLIIIVIFSLILTVAIGSCTYLAVKLSGNVNIKSINTTENKNENKGIVSVDTGVKQENTIGFPYTAQDGYIRNISICKNSIAVLEDGCISLISYAGKILFTSPHSYSSPMIKICDNHILLYDKNSGFYRVFDSKGEYACGEAEETTIVTGAINKSGVFALVTCSNNSSSYLTVYDKTAEKIKFKWKSCPDRITAVAVSPKGDNYAVSVMSAKNGEAISQIYFFNNKSPEEGKPYTITKGTVVDISFVSNNILSVVSTEERILLYTNGELHGYPTSADFGTMLKCKHDSTGNTAVLIKAIGDINTQKALTFNKKNVQQAEGVCCENIKDISVNGSKLYILNDDSVGFYDINGSVIGSVELTEACNLICGYGNNAYCANDTVLYKISLK